MFERYYHVFQTTSDDIEILKFSSTSQQECQDEADRINWLLREANIPESKSFAYVMA